MISSLRFRIGRISLSTLNHYSTKSHFKEAMKLKKIMDKMTNNKKPPNPSPKLLEKGILPSAYKNEGLSRRVAMLNKVYMEQITLILSSGNFGRQLEDLGVEITRVNWASGLNFLNIFWVSKKEGIPEDILNVTLRGALVELQEQMGGIRYTSRVPLLKFVKDLRLEREIKLEKIFESADFGRDFTPVYDKKVLTTDFIHKPSEMPKMPQNVLGLDHARIKERILAEIKKFKAIDTAPHEPNVEEETPEIPHKLIKFSKAEFYKFYKRRRILALKMRKKEKQAGDYVEYEYVDTYEDVQEDADENVDALEEEYEEEDETGCKT